MKYDISKGNRVKGGKFNKRHLSNHNKNTWVFEWVWLVGGWWWYSRLNKWVHYSDPDKILDGNYGGASNCFYGCHSVRAFRRHMRKHSKYLPKGLTFELCGRFKGHHITAKI